MASAGILGPNLASFTTVLLQCYTASEVSDLNQGKMEQAPTSKGL